MTQSESQPSNLSFLNLENFNWQQCLTESLFFLRNSWKQNWLGLEKVVQLTQAFLESQNAYSNQKSADAIIMLDIAAHVAKLIEQEALQEGAKVENPYHNRLHFSQVMASVALQLAILKNETPDINNEWSACLLLCAVAHDYKHPGAVNQQAQEIEFQSYQALIPILVNFGLQQKWQDVIKKVILNTDVPTYRIAHSIVKDKPFEWNVDWASVLLIESDNMASSHPMLGSELGQELEKEWLLLDSPPSFKVSTKEGRTRYLQSLIFSTPSSHILGLPSLVKKEIKALAT